MKTLLLMRHAKSSWKEPKLKDRERPLNKRGRKTAPRMGELIKEKELIPQLILSSSAVRARQTAEIVVASGGCTCEVKYLDSFYMGEPDDYLKQLRKLPDSIERVLVIGHNPGLEALMQILSGKVVALPTAAIAYITLPIDYWKNLYEDTKGELNEVWRPKELISE
jgi:phosphohistidine phosphatase